MNAYEIARAQRIVDAVEAARDYATEISPADALQTTPCCQVVTYPGLSDEQNAKITNDAEAAWRFKIGRVFRERADRAQLEADALITLARTFGCGEDVTPVDPARVRAGS